MHLYIGLVDMVALPKVVICGRADSHAPRLWRSLCLTTLQEYWIDDTLKKELYLAASHVKKVQLFQRVKHLDTLHRQV